MAKPPKNSRSLAPIGNHEVGYCKPPTAHQFKKGEPSANPKGRPKGKRRVDPGEPETSQRAQTPWVARHLDRPRQQHACTALAKAMRSKTM